MVSEVSSIVQFFQLGRGVLAIRVLICSLIVQRRWITTSVELQLVIFLNKVLILIIMGLRFILTIENIAIGIEFIII